MSRKTERLVNLTIALLATKRYVTKSEIFRTVDGYEGSAESKERMFERDKDDLRNLGIEIEVGSFDPIFEDEAGYRIKPESYQFQLGEITSSEIALLSLAAQAWRGAALDGSALTALRKLQSIGIESDLESLPELAPHVASHDLNLQSLIRAITVRRKISFIYLTENLQEQQRVIEPYAVISRYGHWYLYGKDTSKESIRSFRLDRISGAIAAAGKSGAFKIDPKFDLQSELSGKDESKIAEIYLRSSRALALRSRSTSAALVSNIAGWDLLAINYRDRERLIEELLWYGDDVVVASPLDLRAEVIARLEIGVKLHG